MESRRGTPLHRRRIEKQVLRFAQDDKVGGNAIRPRKTYQGLAAERKVSLIESLNPTWEDLSEDWFDVNKTQVLRCVQGDQPSMKYSTIEVAYAGAVATITLNRADKRNAISHQLMEDVL